MLSQRQNMPKVPGWNATDLVLPLSFGLPEGRFGRTKRPSHKTRDFASIIPGVRQTYTFNDEDSYYDSYAAAYFGITMKKSGWDCFRHYEIIAAGSMPYFLDFASLPHNTMHDFPFHIVQEAMELPGVPSQHAVREAMATGSTADLHIDRSNFNETRYNELLREIVAYSLEHLTWKAKAQYLLSNIQRHYPCLTNPRILMVTMRECEYMSCTLFGGLYTMFGPSGMSSLFGPKDELFDSLAPSDSSKMYGRGFSYSRVFSDPWNMTEMDQLTKQRLESGFFNLIIFTNGANFYCGQREYFYWEILQKRIDLLYDYQRKYNPLVAVVDGNDEHGCHKFFVGDNHKLEYHAHFIREFEKARTVDHHSLPIHWSGCDASGTT